ncbi:LuxR family transcriptional regulator [Sphingobium sp. AS12]|uniref:helix-turn-helix transcriptional regulator n=1 Tax=Sphingobium sp. AS12 TaxID=2849495 RepID=UPI001C31AF70|nr:LuxR family transcriptional regulator [Sphingobium sp. AS12]MBV2150052.1 LuxR family transcriptional regulator [Sphingobium sp. AS12]
MAMDPIADCASADDLGAWLERFAREMGFDGGRYVHIGHRVQGAAAAERPPLRFLSTLDDGGEPWRAGDPALPEVVHAFKPFLWSTQDDLSRPDRQRGWLSVERLRGVEAGVAIPIQDYLSGPAYISLFSQTESQVAAMLEARALAMIGLAIDFHCKAKELLSSRPASSGVLTDREVSCLRHAAAGATLVETGANLGIAPRTVELYFARATRKLGATNRINAVAIALGSGLIRI